MSLCIGVNGVARQSVNGYIGVDGVARRIKKIYVGDSNGKAADVYLPSTDAVEPILSQAENISQPRRYPGGASINGTAIFVGGSDYISAVYNTVDFYSPDLTHTVSSIPVAINNLTGTNNDNYAIFAGGTSDYGSSNPVNNVYFYDKNLTLTSSTTENSLPVPVTGLAATNLNGQYAIFTGGIRNTGSSSASSKYEVINQNLAYDNSKTRHSLNTSGITPVHTSGAGSIGNYAVIAGGNNGTGVYKSTKVAFAYDTSLTLNTNVSDVGLIRARCGVARTRKHLLFAGGTSESGSNKVVSIYDTSLTRANGTSLMYARFGIACGSLYGNAVFAGGLGTTLFNVYEVYSDTLTKTHTGTLSTKKIQAGSAKAGNNMLVAGGYQSDTVTAKTVDVITFK